MGESVFCSISCGRCTHTMRRSSQLREKRERASGLGERGSREGRRGGGGGGGRRGGGRGGGEGGRGGGGEKEEEGDTVNQNER